MYMYTYMHMLCICTCALYIIYRGMHINTYTYM